jgi:hypothetical protein
VRTITFELARNIGIFYRESVSSTSTADIASVGSLADASIFVLAEDSVRRRATRDLRHLGAVRCAMEEHSRWWTTPTIQSSPIGCAPRKVEITTIG